MADAPYLVALALVELDGKRALPLTGKSQREASGGEPGEAGRTLALELLLRLWAWLLELKREVERGPVGC